MIGCPATPRRAPSGCEPDPRCRLRPTPNAIGSQFPNAPAPGRCTVPEAKIGSAGSSGFLGWCPPFGVGLLLPCTLLASPASHGSPVAKRCQRLCWQPGFQCVRVPCRLSWPEPPAWWGCPETTAFGVVVRTAQGLAVQGHHTSKTLGKLLHEPQKPLLEGFRIQHSQRSGKGFVAGNAVFQLQEGLQEIPFGRPKSSISVQSLPRA